MIGQYVIGQHMNTYIMREPISGSDVLVLVYRLPLRCACRCILDLSLTLCGHWPDPSQHAKILVLVICQEVTNT